ncbi:hypothetical protein Hdeb2414_s0025g00669401 [Helianthus debilis subsp. tardiflorus]
MTNLKTHLVDQHFVSSFTSVGFMGIQRNLIPISSFGRKTAPWSMDQMKKLFL